MSDSAREYKFHSNTIGIGIWSVSGHNYIAREALLGKVQNLGVAKYWITLNNTVYAPQFSADNYVGLTGSQLQQTGLTDVWQFGGNFSKIIGRHTIRFGVEFRTNNMLSPIACTGESFGTAQTAALGGNHCIGGNSWASLLLGVPRETCYRNIREVTGDGPTPSMFRISGKPRPPHTENRFRNDIVFQPIYGSGTGANLYTGDGNAVTGEYILNALPPLVPNTGRTLHPERDL